MKKSKKDWRTKLNGYFIAFARRAFGWSHFKKKALKEAEVRPGVWRCNGCAEEVEKVHIDHQTPVIPVTGPWSGSWDEYRDGLFTDNLQALCVSCHKSKTQGENTLRKRYRGFNKGKK